MIIAQVEVGGAWLALLRSTVGLYCHVDNESKDLIKETISVLN